MTAEAEGPAAEAEAARWTSSVLCKMYDAAERAVATQLDLLAAEEVAAAEALRTARTAEARELGAAARAAKVRWADSLAVAP